MLARRRLRRRERRPVAHAARCRALFEHEVLTGQQLVDAARHRAAARHVEQFEERHDLRVVEYPITFVDRQYGTSKMSGRIVAESMLLVTAWGLRDIALAAAGRLRRS
mgnify:CR=1 FL=1